MMLTYLSILVLCFTGSLAQYLEVSGQDLVYKGEKVFLSGMNIAWESFGYDFGNDMYEFHSGEALEGYLRDISAAGGNSVRIWIHTDGRDTPNFDDDGYPISPDRTGSFINDLSRYLDVAEQYNILVTLVLWNGAEPPLQKLIDLMYDDSKLDDYIENVLVPTVNALKNKKSLAAWEVINEPEGSLDNITKVPDPCFDGTILQGTGAGWTGVYIPVYQMLRFINRQIAAIKTEDPKTLATIGAWSERSQTDNFGFRDFYTDSCLISAGGENLGTIDFYQMHTYENGGSYTSSSPMMQSNSAYELTKPNVLGEYSQGGGDGRDITDLQEWAYENGYSGGWTWQANGGNGPHSDDFATQARGLGAIAGRSDNGKIDIEIS